MDNAYRDYEWFLDADLQQYGGQWVAILNQQVIAHNQDIGKLMDEAKASFPNTSPFITKIRRKLSILHGSTLSLQERTAC